MLVEFEYRKRFHLSHWQYVDEPGDIIQWMTRIGMIKDQIQREREAQQR